MDKSWFTAPEYAEYRKPGNIKVPFWLQPEKYYAGVAWYQRDIEIPPDWQGKRVVLSLERPHWETRVWVDGKPLGSNNSLSTPHEYDLGTALAPGKHQLTIRVDNGLVVDVGENSHCVTDHTQGNWNGIVGDIELAGDPAGVDRGGAGVSRTPQSEIARVVVKVGNQSGRAGKAKSAGQRDGQSPGAVPESARPVRCAVSVKWRRDRGDSAEFEIALLRAYRTCGMSSLRSYTSWHQSNRPCGFQAVAGQQDRNVRPARDHHPGHAVPHQRPQDLLPRHAGVLHLPAHRPSADRRGLLEAHHPHRQGLWAEPDSVPLLLSAGSGVRRGGRTRLLLPGRDLLGQSVHHHRRRQAGGPVGL